MNLRKGTLAFFKKNKRRGSVKVFFTLEARNFRLPANPVACVVGKPAHMQLPQLMSEAWTGYVGSLLASYVQFRLEAKPREFGFSSLTELNGSFVLSAEFICGEWMLPMLEAFLRFSARLSACGEGGVLLASHVALQERHGSYVPIEHRLYGAYCQ